MLRKIWLSVFQKTERAKRTNELTNQPTNQQTNKQTSGTGNKNNQTVNDGVAHSKNPRKCAYHVTFDLDLHLEHTLDARWPGVYRVQVWWRSGQLSARRSDLRKSLQTDDGRTDDGRRAIALAHSWNELKIMLYMSFCEYTLWFHIKNTITTAVCATIHRRRSSVNFGGDIFARKYVYDKLTKCPSLPEKYLFPEIWAQRLLPAPSLLRLCDNIDFSPALI